MPKSRVRKKSQNAVGGQANRSGSVSRSNRRFNFILGAIAALAMIAGGFYIWRNYQSNNEFEALAAQGQTALASVKTTPNRGDGHLNPGRSQKYPERFPTSGMHHRVPVNPGFYSNVQLSTRLVHSVEHGHIVIYYERPGTEVLLQLQDWTSHYDGHWDGVIAVPFSGLGETVVLTAWRKILRLDKFQPPAAAAFIDKYRGRGPENRVR